MAGGALGAPRTMNGRRLLPDVIQPRREPAEAGHLATGARSLLVSTVFALGLAGLMLSLGEEASPAHASVPAASAPRSILIPQARLAPGFSEETEADLAEAGPAATRAAALPSPAADLAAALQPDPEEVLGFGPMRVRRHLVSTIVGAAQQTGIDPVLLMSIADKESSFAVEVQARTSSATGLFQFIERTWLQVVREFGPRHGLQAEAALINLADGEFTVAEPADRARILELRRDSRLSSLLAAEMLLRDRARIGKAIGRDLTVGETYLAHFLGPDDAERFLSKVVAEPAASAAALLPRPARANKPIFFARARRKMKALSVAEVHQKFEAMMTLRSERYRAAPTLVAAVEPAGR